MISEISIPKVQLYYFRKEVSRLLSSQTKIDVASIEDPYFKEIFNSLTGVFYIDGYEPEKTADILTKTIRSYVVYLDWKKEKQGLRPVPPGIPVSYISHHVNIEDNTRIIFPDWTDGSFNIEVRTPEEWLLIHHDTLTVFEKMFYEYWRVYVFGDNGTDTASLDLETNRRYARSRILNMIEEARKTDEIHLFTVIRLQELTDLIIPRYMKPDNLNTKRPVWTTINLSID